jgi:hypothetical protein
MLPVRQLIAWTALMASALPADAHDGNAPGLSVPGSLRQQNQRIGHALKKLPLTLPSMDRALLYTAGGDLQVTQSSGSLSLDLVSKTVDTVTTLELKSNVDGILSIYLYMEQLSGGMMTLSDSQGPLTVQDQGFGTFSVTLREPLLLGQSLTLQIQRGGTPICTDPQFFDEVFCEIQADRAFIVGLAWQPMVLPPAGYGMVFPEQGILEVTVPSTYEVAASGITLSDTAAPGGMHTVTLANDFNGIFSLGIASYTVGSSSFGSGQQARSFLFGSAAIAAQQTWRDEMVTIMNHFITRYGPYAPPKVDLVEISEASYAARSEHTAIFLPSFHLASDPAGWYETLVLAHELSHQWFGLSVEVDFSASPLLDEGFAMFSETDYANLKGQTLSLPDLGQHLRLQQRQEVLYLVPPQQEVPITSEALLSASADVYYALGYSKTSMVVNMLRYLLGGDTPFFAAMRSFVADHVDKAASVAGLKQALEQASGLDLSAFFDRWVYDTGYPTYTVRVVRSHPGQVRIEINADADYALPLPIRVDYADGTGELEQLPLTAPSTSFTLELSSDQPIVGIQFDPERQLISRHMGALSGDIYLDGEVDGIDLLYAALPQGQDFKSMFHSGSTKSFHGWADLQMDGQINDQDLAVVLQSFGKKEGE